MTADLRLDRLLQLGKQRGRLTPHDLHQVLDVERLSMDELSHMLERLEQAGVSVEFDTALLAPASGRADLAQRPDTDLTEGRELPSTTRAPSEAPTLTVQEKSKAAPSIILLRPGYVRDKAAWTAVAVALGIILLLALLVANTL
jgi:hypothetical protein